MNNKMIIKAIIFDWAGTTVDYGCIAPAGVFVEIFERRKIMLTVEEARGPMGLAKRDHIAELLKLQTIRDQWLARFLRLPSEEDLNELYQELEPAMASIAENYASPIPGTIELAEELKHNGIKIGTTTGYVESIMKRVMPAAAKQGFIPDAMVNSSDVPAGRPAPFMCYMNAVKLKVFPFQQMIKIGDTVADVQEGLNAGMWTIGITQSGNEIGLSQEDIEKTDPSVLEHKIKLAEEKLHAAGAHFTSRGTWRCMPIIQHIDELCKQGYFPQNYHSVKVNEGTIKK